jgi:hypothetical protein
VPSLHVYPQAIHDLELGATNVCCGWQPSPALAHLARVSVAVGTLMATVGLAVDGMMNCAPQVQHTKTRRKRDEIVFDRMSLSWSHAQ